MASLFSRIVSGEIPCHKVYEDDDFLAFLDVFPLVTGHTLVIPKKEIDYLFDIEDELYIRLMLCSKKVAQAVQQAVPCRKVGVTVIGLEVPHAHVHLIPMNQVSDMNFSREKQSVTQDELAETASRVSSFL